MSAVEPISERPYGHLSRDALGARLKIAEDALTMVGWTANIHSGTERGDAALEMWMTWLRMSGHDASPAANQHLVRMEASLAASRRRARESTLRRISEP